MFCSLVDQNLGPAGMAAEVVRLYDAKTAQITGSQARARIAKQHLLGAAAAIMAETIEALL